MATIQELESFKMSDAVKFHKELNPQLWEDHKLDPEVRDQLLLIAEDFVEYLGLDNLKVEDVTISGSNAAYSYTPHSDLDLHVLVDFNQLPNNEVYQELFTAKKTLYNDAHDISVHGVPVELYVQDTNNPVHSLGEYSIVHDRWIRIPKKRRANYDEAATKAKYEKLGDLIEIALKSKDPKRVADTIALVKRYRKSGLDKHGEFGPENLAYKAVRKQGLVQALYDLKAQLHGEKLSIEEEHKLLNKPTLTVAEIAEKHGVDRMQIAKQLDKGVKVELEHTKDKSVAREIALDHLAEDPKYYDKLAKVELEENQYTFAGKDPMSFKSPNGGTPTMLLVTGQGSRYLVTSDGMVLRNKSFHASTGGEDQGLKDWSGAIEFYDPNEKPGGAPFALTVSKAVEKKLPVALSNTKDGKRALLIYDGKQWRVAKVSDIYNNVASNDDPIVATYSKTPKLSWNVFDYDVDSNNRIVRAHPGSPVTHGIQLNQPTQLDETAHESQLVNLISKRAAEEIFKMLRKKESTLAKVLGPDTKREKLQYWGISAEKLGVPYVNDPVLGSVLHHAKFIAVDYIDRLRPKRVASYDPNTHEILVHYPAIVRDASDYGYETEQYLAKIIAHELQHAVDNFKSRGKAFDTKKTAYATLPYEINARFQEALMNMTIEFDEARKRGKILKRTDLPRFVDGALEHNIISQYLPKDGKRYKQLAKRAYKFFDAEFNNPKQEKPLSLGKRAINYILGKPTSSVNESIAYHVTPTRNLRSIMKNGLRPQIGDRSSQLDGEVEGIFLFPSLGDVEAAVSSWLGDEFDEDEELSLLAVDITGLENNIVQGADYETIVNTTISPDRIKVDDSLLLEASGYIPSAKEKNDPRFKTALTVDVKPDSIKKNAKAFNWKTSRAGIPPQARPDGKIAEDLMNEWKSFLAEDQEQQELFPGYDEKHRQERLNAWLGKSQAVTATYKPKVLYHATTKHFDQFRAQNKGFASALGMAFEVDRSGIFLAENPKFAAEYIEDEYGAYKENAVIIPVYLSAQYTFVLTDSGLSPMLNDEALVEEFKEHDIDLRSIYYHIYEDQRWELFDGPEGEEFVANLKKLGYDSAFMYEDSKYLGRNGVWVAFEPSQVKAITNRGSFSPDDPRMMKENG